MVLERIAEMVEDEMVGGGEAAGTFSASTSSEDAKEAGEPAQWTTSSGDIHSERTAGCRGSAHAQLAMQ